ncbi:MAG TPA: hypothetical protein VIG99_31945 [Myxococcaceae bacterium]|jgi:hypothetical protein
MRLPSPALLFLLCGATAAAHEDPFRALWVQPLAPLVTRTFIVPVGLSYGLAPETDLTVELTPYAWLPAPLPVGAEDAIDPCASNICGNNVHGLIATIGVAFGHPLLSRDDWELGLFAAPKALAAVATMPGDRALFFGTSYELGAGLDVGLEMHAHGSGLYAAIVVGMQMTRAFSSGRFILPASWPAGMVSNSGIVLRPEALVIQPNSNLFRIGWVF